MLKDLYSLFDRKAGFYNPPFVQDAFARPNMAELMRRSFPSILKQNPNAADFDLYRVGTFDDENGLIGFADPNQKPVFVLSLNDFVPKEAPKDGD